MEDRVPLLLDTDIGSDIDDAVCLTYLLAEPRCELLGITTVTGQPRQRAMLADGLCRLAGREDVPIYSGCDVPLLLEQRQPQAPQAEVLKRWPHREDFEPYAAVEFLRKTIRSRPGEITLLTVGPLTNIGLLFAVDPEVPGMLKQLVMMAGYFGGEGGTEWNASGDPTASALVFGAAVPDLVAYGVDVTLQVTMPGEECRERFTGGPFEMVSDMAEVWFRKRADIVFHDPLAAACVFDPDLCTYRTGTVTVGTDPVDEAQFGRTSFGDSPIGAHRVAAAVNAKRFFKHYFDVTSVFARQ